MRFLGRRHPLGSMEHGAKGRFSFSWVLTYFQDGASIFSTFYKDSFKMEPFWISCYSRNLNHENRISENFLGEEWNFPGWGTGMKPERPKAARATFLARILGNFVPHRENFQKYYSHDSNSFQLDNYHLKAITVHFKSVNCLKIVESCLIFSWNTHTSKKWVSNEYGQLIIEVKQSWA